jgi:hypothetical protein
MMCGRPVAHGFVMAKCSRHRKIGNSLSVFLRPTRPSDVGSFSRCKGVNKYAGSFTLAPVFSSHDLAKLDEKKRAELLPGGFGRGS